MGHDLSLLKRLTVSAQGLDAAELASETARQPCQRLAAVRAGEPADVYGRLTSVRYLPTATTPVLEAELYDGSATIRLVWLGRRRIPGIEPGRKVLARGRVGIHRGELAIYNPWYELR